MSKELVNHPEHYNKPNRKECWDEMIEIFGADAVAIFDVLSAYKYHYRAGDKDGNPAEQDIAKIDVYMKHARKMLETYSCDECAIFEVLNKAGTTFEKMEMILS